MRHTAECLERQIRYATWALQWPKHCTRCNATGTIHFPGVYYTKNGDGWPDEDDACHCSELDAADIVELTKRGIDMNDYDHYMRCPRCTDPGVNTQLTAPTCPNCGWANGKGIDDYLPEVDCHCYEIAR